MPGLIPTRNQARPLDAQESSRDTTRRAIGNEANALMTSYFGLRANADLAADRGDLVAFGHPFIGNPDLVEKLQNGSPLETAHPNTFYMPDAKGYTEFA